MHPLRTLWVLGDTIVDHVAPHLIATIQNAPDELYLTKNYDIKCFNADNKQGFLSNNFLVRVSNTLTTALNVTEYAMPAAIVIMIDNKYLKEDYFGDRHLASLVNVMLQNIIDTIRKRKRQLSYPYWEEHQPKIIILRPIPRPAYSIADPDKYKNIRRKYAQELEDITTKLRVSLVNLDELNCSQRVLFDDFGNLSDYGIEKFWKSLSDHFRRVDRDEHYAIKKFRTPKKSAATQTYTAQSGQKAATPQSHQTIQGPNLNQPKITQQPGNSIQNLPVNQHIPNSHSQHQWNQNYQGNHPNQLHNLPDVKQKPYYNAAVQYQGSYPQNDRYHVNNNI